MDKKNLKKVIFTTITGGYDYIPQPRVIAKDFEYILFTNDMPEQQLGVWQVRHIPYKSSNNVKLSRWVKTHPHILLDSYDVSLYHDCNVIVDKHEYFDRINELIEENTPIAFMSHIFRHCIYEEGFEVMYLNIEKVLKVLREMAHIKHDNYPVNNGLVEANCIYRNHHDPKVIQFCEKWWYMIDNYTQRDQLSCNYVAWKCGLEIEYILPKGNSTRNHPYIHCNKHQQKKINIDKIIWYGSMKDRFKSHAQKHYNRFVSSKCFSTTELFSYAMIIIIRKYYSMVALKYKVATKIKNAFSEYRTKHK